MAAAKGRRTARSAPRRRLIWARHDFVAVGVAVNGVVRENILGDLETQVGHDLVGCTVMRIRGRIELLTADSQGRFAAIVARQRPFGAVSEDGPYGSEHDNWMMWEPVSTGSAAAGNNSSHVGRRIIDVRSMRKLDEVDQELQLWFGSSPANGGVVTVRWDVSTLIALP